MEEIREMELDELCTFLYAKRTSIGLEKPLLVTEGMVSPELWVAVIMVKSLARAGCAGCIDDGVVYADVVLSGQLVAEGTQALEIMAPAGVVN
jgi:hypothetical protein